jgi:putative drug exporter of the RND superfamily
MAEARRLARAGRWCARHPRRVLIAWVALLALARLASAAAGSHTFDGLSLKGTESRAASDVLRRDVPARSGDVDQVVLRGTLGAAGPVLRRIADAPHVAGVGPLTRAGGTAFATVTFDRPATDVPLDAVEHVIAIAERARSADLDVELGGAAIERARKPSIGPATAIGLLAAIVVLLLAFRSALAMGMTMASAVLGLGTALAFASLSTHLVYTPSFATRLATLIGLGVGIDYALFVVTRFRESYAGSGDLHGAIEATMDTAGRAVLFAGATVIVALLGLFTLGTDLLDGLAVSCTLAVAMTMLAALTVLPAALARFGSRIAAQSPRRAGLWPRWTAFVQRHPWPALAAGLAVMLTLAVPVHSLRLGASDAGNDPTGTTTRRAYDQLAGAFGPGFNGPLQVVVEGGGADRVASALRTTPGIASVSAPVGAGTAVLTAVPRSAPQSSATTALVNELRADLPRETHTRVLIGGETASSIDFTHVLAAKLPLFIAVVVVLSALLLLAVFRSIAIPVQAVLMNLLSFGGALGIAIAVFQWGWLGTQPGPIDAYIPVVMFAVVFGLSMDYEVFLISRVHEAWTRRHDAGGAVFEGFSSTGRVITAAATIMLVVFGSFITGDLRVLKLFGLALASAVALDAFVVRSLLLPATLQLLGERAWRLPRRLDRRLPRIALEEAN